VEEAVGQVQRKTGEAMKKISDAVKR
jgi:uncharacterized protein YjbJ (UPF0337 family)